MRRRGASNPGVGSKEGLDGELGPVDGLAPFGLHKCQDFTAYDLMYVNNGMLFCGARNFDGAGFEKLENRPTNPQIPMVQR
jgi:hypothetical protein